MLHIYSFACVSNIFGYIVFSFPVPKFTNYQIGNSNVMSYILQIVLKVMSYTHWHFAIKQIPSQQKRTTFWMLVEVSVFAFVFFKRYHCKIKSQFTDNCQTITIQLFQTIKTNAWRMNADTILSLIHTQSQKQNNEICKMLREYAICIIVCTCIALITNIRHKV